MKIGKEVEHYSSNESSSKNSTLNLNIIYDNDIKLKIYNANSRSMRKGGRFRLNENYKQLLVQGHKQCHGLGLSLQNDVSVKLISKRGILGKLTAAR